MITTNAFVRMDLYPLKLGVFNYLANPIAPGLSFYLLKPPRTLKNLTHATLDG